MAIEAIRWTPDYDRLGVSLVVRLNRAPPRGTRLTVRLLGDRPRRVLVDDSFAIEGDELSRVILLDADATARRRYALTWSPERPRLIDAEIALVDAAGTVLDRVTSYFGLRSVAASDGRFLLNGNPTFMRLVLAQNYWPTSHLAAPSPGALRREVELAKSLGFNGVRIHQKIEDPRFIAWCDRLGLMVWAEAANAYRYDDRAAEALTREWLDAVRRDYNHPSIIAWVPLNESWGVPQLDRDPAQQAFVQALYHLTKALDPTRLVLGNDGWSHGVGDLLGVHDYAVDGATLTERYGSRTALAATFEEVRPHHHALSLEGHLLSDEPVVISEMGGLSFAPRGDENWFGYGKFEDEAALIAGYAELVGALLDSTVLAGFCDTQLTDTEQETNGLLDAERRPKLDVGSIRAVNERPSKAVPSEVLEQLLRQDRARRRNAPQASG